MATRQPRLRSALPHQKVYRLRRTDFTVDFTVTFESDGAVLAGLSIFGPRSGSLHGTDVDLELAGARGPYNATGFPADAPLPQLALGPARTAVATFRFERVIANDTPETLSGHLHGRRFAIRLDDPQYVAKPNAPAPRSIQDALKSKQP